MIKQQIHVCHACEKSVDFNGDKDFILRDEQIPLLQETIIVNDAKIPVCPECGEEIFDEILDNQLLQDAMLQYEKQTGSSYMADFLKAQGSK